MRAVRNSISVAVARSHDPHRAHLYAASPRPSLQDMSMIEESVWSSLPSTTTQVEMTNTPRFNVPTPSHANNDESQQQTFDDIEKGGGHKDNRNVVESATASSSKAAIIEMFWYVLFLLLFSMSILRRSSQSTLPYDVQSMASQRFTPASSQYQGETYSFLNIHDTKAMWAWLSGPLIVALDHTDTYFDRNMLIGGVLLLQKRVQSEACEVTISTSTQHTRDNTLGHCYPSYSSSTASTSAYGLKSAPFTFSYSNQRNLNRVLLYPDQAQWGRDEGFRAIISNNKSSFHNTSTSFLSMLKNGKWIDANTAAVFVDFTVFAPSVRTFIVSRLHFEFFPSGGIKTKSSYRVHRILTYETSVDILFAVIWCLLFVGVVVYFVGTLKDMSVQRWAYFADGWNWIHLTNISIFFAVFIIRTICDVQGYALVNDVATHSYVDFQAVAYSLNQIDNLSAFNVVLCFLKVFKFLKASPSMSQLTRVLSFAAKPIAVFLAMFFILYSGFAIGYYMAFGGYVGSYRSVGSSYLSLFRAMLGDFNYEDMQNENSFLTALLFVSFIILVLMVLLNFFLAIINDSYIQVQTQVITQSDPFADELNSFFKNMKKRVVSVWRRLVRRDSVQPYEESCKSDQHPGISVQELESMLKANNGAALLLGLSKHTSTAALAEHLMCQYDTRGAGYLDNDAISRINGTLSELARQHTAQQQAKRLLKIEEKLSQLLSNFKTPFNAFKHAA